MIAQRNSTVKIENTMKRREFLSKALRVAAVAPMGIALETLPAQEIEAQPAPYLDAARTAVIDQWERIFDQTIVKLEKAWGNLVEARATAPADVDAVSLHDAIEDAYQAIERLISQVDSAEFDEAFSEITGRKHFYAQVESELNKPGCDFDWWEQEIELLSKAHPDEGRRLLAILKARRGGVS